MQEDNTILSFFTGEGLPPLTSCFTLLLLCIFHLAACDTFMHVHTLF